MVKILLEVILMETINKKWWTSPIDFFKPKSKAIQESNSENLVTPKSSAYFSSNSGNSRLLFVSSFDGEKNLGEIGPAQQYILNYVQLRERGWGFYLTNEVVQIIINRMTVWTIGRGLKLESEPNESVLLSEGIKINPQAFSDLVESRFSIYKESKMSTYDGMRNLSKLESACYKNSKIAGDVLVVLRVIKGILKTQLIDGTHVMSPMYGNDWNPQKLANGNRIMNGVEMNDAGEHVAYHVRNADLTFSRIAAKSPTTGLTVAYLVGGLEYRLDNSRCIPALAGLFETLAKMDRYKEATIATAEESAKTTLQIVHEANSTGESPYLQQIVQARDVSANDGTIPVDVKNTEIANKVAVSTNKQVFNMTQGSKLEPVEKSKAELYFKDFYSVFFDLVCAAIGIPPNVAMSKYDTSFSSARAAIKDWEHTLLVERYNFSLSFNQPIYEMWLHLEILQNKVSAPGYMIADRQNNYMVLASFRNARWVGDNVPHIDPLKEVNAERLKLGDTGASLPLTTLESATEVVNGGSSKANMKQYAKELEESKTAGIEVAQPPVQNPAP
jgi:capsid protein